MKLTIRRQTFGNAITNNERALLWGMFFFIAFAYALPSISQAQDYHHFADGRDLFGIKWGYDVLSNLAFAASGLWGLRALSARKSLLDASMLWGIETFFWGVLATSLGSAWYHLAPSDATLVWDRLPMTVAFAGILATLCSERVGRRAGFIALGCSLAYGAAAIYTWTSTGNLTPYVAMQMGGIAAIAWAWRTAPSNTPVPWGQLLGFYIAAKFAESFDAQILHASLGAFSGHTAKHLLAAMAAASVARAIWKLRSAAEAD